MCPFNLKNIKHHYNSSCSDNHKCYFISFKHQCDFISFKHQCDFISFKRQCDFISFKRQCDLLNLLTDTKFKLILVAVECYFFSICINNKLRCDPIVIHDIFLLVDIEHKLKCDVFVLVTGNKCDFFIVSNLSLKLYLFFLLTGNNCKLVLICFDNFTNFKQQCNFCVISTNLLLVLDDTFSDDNHISTDIKLNSSISVN